MGAAVREVYQAELRALIEGALALARMVETALGRVGPALLDADHVQAQSVGEALEPVERLHAELDDRAVDLIARQQPVARDLRTIVAVLRMNTDLERMGALTRHLAEIAQPVGLPTHRGGSVRHHGRVMTPDRPSSQPGQPPEHDQPELRNTSGPVSAENRVTSSERIFCAGHPSPSPSDASRA